MNRPCALTQYELASVLRDMADRVSHGDSFEGSIEYVMPMPEDGDVPESTYAMVRASYRIGNKFGQGGVRIIAGERGTSGTKAAQTNREKV